MFLSQYCSYILLDLTEFDDTGTLSNRGPTKTEPPHSVGQLPPGLDVQGLKQGKDITPPHTHAHTNTCTYQFAHIVDRSVFK